MHNSVARNTYDSTWKSTGRVLIECKWATLCREAKQLSKTARKLNILERFNSMFGISS